MDWAGLPRHSARLPLLICSSESEKRAASNFQEIGGQIVIDHDPLSSRFVLNRALMPFYGKTEAILNARLSSFGCCSMLIDEAAAED
jgi:hypothetical protein